MLKEGATTHSLRIRSYSWAFLSESLYSVKSPVKKSQEKSYYRSKEKTQVVEPEALSLIPPPHSTVLLSALLVWAPIEKEIKGEQFNCCQKIFDLELNFHFSFNFVLSHIWLCSRVNRTSAFRNYCSAWRGWGGVGHMGCQWPRLACTLPSALPGLDFL